MHTARHLVSAVTLAIAITVAGPSAHAAPLLASRTTVAGYPFFGPQGPTDLHVIVVAEVSQPVVGLVTQATVTFTVGLPGGETITLSSPVGPCLPPVSRCMASRDFHAEVSCDANAPLIWVKATYSGETVDLPVDAAITGPSTSDVYWISRCPTHTF